MLFLLQMFLAVQVGFAAPKAAPIQLIAPTSLTATAVSTSQINLAWGDPNSAESGYEIWRQTPPSTTWSKIATTGANATTWSNTGLAQGTTYSYEVRAFVVSGHKTSYSAYSPVAMATTLAALPSPPVAGVVTPSPQSGSFVPGQFNLSTSFSSSATLTGCEYTPDGVNWYAASVSGASPNFTCTKNAIPASNGQSLGLNMRATNGGGTGTGAMASRVADANAPTTTSNAPAGWVAADQTVSLTAGDGTGAGVAYTRYCVDSTNLCAPSTTGTSILVSCAAGSVCQTYVRFASTDNVGNVETTKSALVRIDKSAPTTTSNAPAGWVAADQIVTLTAADSGAGVVAYTQYCVDTTNLCTPATTGTSVSITCATGAVCQSYLRFRSADSAGNVEATKAALVRIDKSAPSTTSNAPAGWVAADQTIALTASDGTGAGVANTQFCTDTTNSCTPATTGASASVTCAAGTACQTYLRFRSTDIVGNIEVVKSSLVSIDKALPRDGTLSASPSSGQVVLSWTAASDVGSGLSASFPYKLVFSTGAFPTSCSSGTVLMTGTGTSFTQTNLANGTTYYYRVCATDAVGNVSTGATASATPAGTNQPPVANAGPSQSTQTLTSITFNGSGSTDPDGTIVSYAWNFGDSTTGTGVTASHSYSTSGTYTVTLTVTDNLGATGSASTTATISNRPPVANAGLDKSAAVGTSVTIDGSGSYDSDGSITSYSWTFGDGASLSSGNVASVSHTYNATGTYTVTLTVTDNKGATASDQAVITVTSTTGGGAFQWVKRFGSSGASSVIGYTTATDASGNVIVAGTFSGTVDFGGGPLVSAGGSADVFVAKFNSAGTHMWSKRFGDTIDDAAYSVAVDVSGNIIVAGEFKGTINFGGGNLVAVYNGMPPPTYDAFVVKLSPSGSHVWSRSFGSWSDDWISGVAVDSNGNVFVVGTFVGNVDFGGLVLQSASSSQDIFLAKYLAANGQLAWAKKFGSSQTDGGNAVAVDGNGNVVMTGLFRGTADFGGGPLTSAGSADIVVAEYSTDGVYLWAKAIGGTGNDDAYGVAADRSGNVLLTGYVYGSVDFGGGPTTSIGSWDTFVAKYSSTGSYVWAKRFGSTLQDEGLSIASDVNGNVFVAGTFQGTADFGTGPLTSAGSWDIFVAKYSGAGTALWSKSFGSAGDDFGYAVAVDGSGNAVVTGAFQQTVDFGGGPLTATGWSDTYLLKIGP